MIEPPLYFEEIRREAADLWETLDQNPKLAGAWHQLFKQVQNPRHVISELLQNADDAGAKRASVTIEDGYFVFRHDGQDFDKTTFASLCNFAYSNKRTLHTIGFRGIGFKSIFSLGDVVELESPSLSVSFNHRRFTEPVWINKPRSRDGLTSFRVKIKDRHRHAEIEKSIGIWHESPSSLLFFRSVRNLQLADNQVEWKSNGTGPNPGSEWLAMTDADSVPVLLVRSQAEAFPEESLREIREERMVDNDDTPLPPCSVELVLGIEGELFVVLPTGVNTQLPFACNAPFVQDPARLKIKNPEISPTNRWLLKRLGELAGKAMLDWLAKTTLTTQERSRAYGLMTRFEPDDSTIEGSCESIVAEAFHGTIAHRALLLTESGELVRSNESIAVRDWLNQVWSSAQVSEFFDEDERPLFCKDVTGDGRRRLVDAEYLDELAAESILVILQTNHLPRPSSWRQLLILWDAVAPAVSKTRYSWEKSWADIRIVPVQGRDCLYSADEVVRLSEKRLLRTDSDWEFLSQFLLVLNVNWPRYIAEQRRMADKSENYGLAGQVQNAEKLLGTLSLTESSDTGLILERVAEAFFGQDEDERPDKDCIRLAHIAATLGASAPESFEFITADGQLAKLGNYDLLADPHWDLRDYVPAEWYENYVIHEDYWQSFESCSRDDWEQWIASGRSGLLQFPPISKHSRTLWYIDDVRTLVSERGGTVNKTPYSKWNSFTFQDRDFDEEHWDHWTELATNEPTFWWNVVKRICEQSVDYWAECLNASLSQTATNGWEKPVETGRLVPEWILKLRELSCLQDTWGRVHQPAELFRRTPETENLFDIEPFVRAEIDTEALRPLLIALGVRDKATDPTRLLERLQALATVDEPRLDEVLKWCRRLDALIAKCPTADFERVKQAFREQPLILTADGNWARVSEVYLGSGDADVPGTPVIHPDLRSLSIWFRIGVSERPTIDKILEWLRDLPASAKLSPEDAKRIRELIPFHAERMWNECDCWLNLEGEWVSAERFKYRLSFQDAFRFKWATLFPQIRRVTADFQKLPTDLAGRPPFSELPSLADQIHERVQVGLENGYAPEERPWLAALGSGLARMTFDSQEKTARVRQLGKRMIRTGWQQASQLEAVPYLDGTPAGTPRREDAFWDDSALYIVQKPWTKLFPSVAQVLTGASDDQDLARAIRDCIDRSPQFIDEYLEDHFDLAPPEERQLPEEQEPSDGPGVVEVITQGHSLEGDDEPDNDPSTDEAAVPDEESIDAEEHHPDDGDQKDGRPRHPPTRPAKPPLVDRFAQSMGFKKNADGRFNHPDGRWIERASGHAFPWEMYSFDGDLQKCFWVKEHCLAREPLQLPSEIWQLCEDEPDKYSLVLVTPDDAPQDISGEQLQRMKVDGSLQLYPASYRLVLQGAG